MCLGLIGCGQNYTPIDDEGISLEVPLVYEVENTGADCPEPPLPSFNELPIIEALPDPFMWSPARNAGSRLRSQRAGTATRHGW